jgi:membrane protease YdiL (CAAX protease family)
MPSMLLSLSLILLVSLLVLLASMRRLPDLGVALSLVVIALVVWRRPGGLEQIGFLPVESWPRLLAFSLLCGALVSLGALVLLEPLTERLTGRPHDLRLVEHLRGDLQATLLLLPLVWLLVAPIEEILFRGFLMNELVLLLGEGFLALCLNLLLSSILFGLAHWYQGPSGVLSTGVVGLILGAIFIWTGFNVWPVIFTHAFVDTVSLLLLYANLDKKLKHALIKPGEGAGEGTPHESDR